MCRWRMSLVAVLVRALSHLSDYPNISNRTVQLCTANVKIQLKCFIFLSVSSDDGGAWWRLFRASGRQVRCVRNVDGTLGVCV